MAFISICNTPKRGSKSKPMTSNPRVKSCQGLELQSNRSSLSWSYYHVTGAECRPEEFRFDLSLASTVFVSAVWSWQSQPAPCCLGMIASLASALLGIFGSLQNGPARKNKHPRTGIKFIFIADGSHTVYSNNFSFLNHSRCSDHFKIQNQASILQLNNSVSLSIFCSIL